MCFKVFADDIRLGRAVVVEDGTGLLQDGLIKMFTWLKKLEDAH